jgi:hypothetical protein
MLQYLNNIKHILPIFNWVLFLLFSFYPIAQNNGLIEVASCVSIEQIELHGEEEQTKDTSENSDCLEASLWMCQNTDNFNLIFKDLRTSHCFNQASLFSSSISKDILIPPPQF